MAGTEPGGTVVGESDSGGSCVVSVPEDDGTEVYPLGGVPVGGGGAGSKRGLVAHGTESHSPSAFCIILKGGGGFILGDGALGGTRDGGGMPRVAVGGCDSTGAGASEGGGCDSTGADASVGSGSGSRRA